MKILNRVLALLLGLAVIAAAVLFIVEVVADRVGAHPVIVNWHGLYHWAQGTSWGAAPVRTASVLLVLLGLVVTITQLKPRRPERLAITSDDPATDAAITRQGVARSIQHSVTAIDGVHTAEVHVRRRVTIHAALRADRATTADRDTITQVAHDAIDTLRLRQPPQLSVRVSTKER